GGFPYGGGGGGGRIALSYSSNSFAGSIDARGGLGAIAGGAGTIYSIANSSRTANLMADNGGVRGTNTTFDSLSYGQILVGGAASLTSSVTQLTLSNLTVGANSAFLVGVQFILNAS